VRNFKPIIEFVESGLGKTIEVFAKVFAASRRRKRRGGVMGLWTSPHAPDPYQS